MLIAGRPAVILPCHIVLTPCVEHTPTRCLLSDSSGVRVLAPSLLSFLDQLGVTLHEVS
jgi:hypothetical protein